MQTIGKNGRANEDRGQARRLVEVLTEKNAVDATHVPPVPIDDALVEHVTHDIHR
jgi:hypothetical protein